MRTLTTLIAGAACLAGCSVAANRSAAEAGIADFHKALDAGQFDTIYDGASPDMKTASAPQAFGGMLAAVHRKLGAFRSGTAVNWNDSHTMKGEFVTISYAAIYERGKAQESFAYRMLSGRAELAGYHIASDALILN
ncbi:DUF4019 domain-containing protein [Sphingomonas sp. MMS24-J13]|uniref:DUF4019 domain-containing protein n=1 Tax=Sphingomonas sp. MMS24-J13 TaxID=3238686 RepID=UPI00384BBF9C